MASKSKSASLDRKKLLSDPVMVGMIVILLVFLTLFICYPLFVLLIDSVYTEGQVTLDVFRRVLSMQRFRQAFGHFQLKKVCRRTPASLVTPVTNSTLSQ